jgi:hypothetical protein
LGPAKKSVMAMTSSEKGDMPVAKAAGVPTATTAALRQRLRRSRQRRDSLCGGAPFFACGDEKRALAGASFRQASAGLSP